MSAAGGSWASRPCTSRAAPAPQCAAPGARRGRRGRRAVCRQPRAGRVRPRGVARRRPLVDGGAGRPPLLRGRARVGPERVRLPRRERGCWFTQRASDADWVGRRPSAFRRHPRDPGRAPRRRAPPIRRPARAARPPTGGTASPRPDGSKRCAPGTASARACASGSVSLNTIPVRESPNTTLPERFTHGIPNIFEARHSVPGADRVDDVVVALAAAISGRSAPGCQSDARPAPARALMIVRGSRSCDHRQVARAGRRSHAVAGRGRTSLEAARRGMAGSRNRTSAVSSASRTRAACRAGTCDSTSPAPRARRSSPQPHGERQLASRT